MEDKQTHLCRKCTCLANVDIEAMNRTALEYDIRVAETSNLGDFKSVFEVDDVKNGAVCAKLCLDKVLTGDRTDIDSWRFGLHAVSSTIT